MEDIYYHCSKKKIDNLVNRNQENYYLQDYGTWISKPADWINYVEKNKIVA